MRASLKLHYVKHLILTFNTQATKNIVEFFLLRMYGKGDSMP